MNHVSFGSTLKEARIAKGYDLGTVARKLRIRPDILQAIEEGDFNRMPPRGYARNMINAYARLLGLNASDVTRMYLDEAYANQIDVAHRDATQMRYNQRNTSAASMRPARHTESFERVDDRFDPNARSARRAQADGSTNRLGRRTYSLENEDKISGGSERTYARQAAAADSARPRRSQRSALTEGKYTNAVRGTDGPLAGFDLRSKLPFIIGALILVIALFVILNLTVCHKSDEAETIPVTQETTEEATEEKEEVKETAPEDFTLSYEVTGKSAYIEVVVDGKTVFADDAESGSKESYTSEDTIKFTVVGRDNVTVKINDEEIELAKDSAKGVSVTTITMDSVLDDWYSAHPDVKKPTSSKSSSKSSSKASSSDDEDDENSATESKTKSSSKSSSDSGTSSKSSSDSGTSSKSSSTKSSSDSDTKSSTKSSSSTSPTSTTSTKSSSSSSASADER